MDAVVFRRVVGAERPDVAVGAAQQAGQVRSGEARADVHVDDVVIIVQQVFGRVRGQAAGLVLIGNTHTGRLIHIHREVNTHTGRLIHIHREVNTHTGRLIHTQGG